MDLTRRTAERPYAGFPAHAGMDLYPGSAALPEGVSPPTRGWTLNCDKLFIA